MADTSWMSDSVAELIEKVQVEMDRGSGKDGSELGLDEATDAAVMSSIIQRGSENSEKVDCLHPHAKGCWMLLVRALTDPGQGIIRTSEAKIEDGAARFEELMSDLLPNLLKERSDDSNSIDGELEEPDLAASLEFTPNSVGMFLSSIELGEVVGKPDSRKTKLLEDHKATTEELVVLIDLAIALGDYETYGMAMEILKDVNPSAHRAIECLTGLPTLMASATSGRGKIGVAEFFQGWMSSGKGDIVGGLSGYKYFEKNNWSEYTDGKKEGWGGWFRDRIAEWGPELVRYTANSVKGAEERDRDDAQKLITKAREIVNERISDTSDTNRKTELKAVEEKLQDLDLLYGAGKRTPSEARGQVLVIMGVDEKAPEDKSASSSSGSSNSSSSGPSNSSSGSSDEGGAVGGGSDEGGWSDSGIDIDYPDMGDTGGGGSGDVAVYAGGGIYYIEELPPGLEPHAGKMPKDDPILFPGLESWVLFVQDLPDSGPEEEGKILRGKPVTDSELYKLDAFLSTVKLSQEAQEALAAKQIPIDIDEFAGAFLPLPGSAETLEECGAVDPDPDQLGYGYAAVFGSQDAGTP